MSGVSRQSPLRLISSRKAIQGGVERVTGIGALVVNFTCAMQLAAHRHGSGSLTKAAFLSARNDVFANVAIIAAGLVTLGWRSAWPDLAVGVAIGLLNAGAAWEIWKEARSEARPGDIEP